jgi:hypothetical protein
LAARRATDALAGADRASVRLLETFRAEFERGDTDAFKHAAPLYYEETTRAYGLPKGDRVQQLGAALLVASSTRGWGMEPIRSDQLDFRLCAGDRLLDCTARDWQPALRSLSGFAGGPLYFEVKLGEIGGELQVLR